MNYEDLELKCENGIIDFDYFTEFNNELNKSKEIRRIYRGDKVGSENDIQYYFEIGTKGKYFEKGKKKTYLDFNLSSKEIIEKIYGLIKNSFEIDESIRNKSGLDEEFINYFNSNSISQFYKVLSRMSERELLIIRDYYLRYLHQFQMKEYHARSFMLSASYDYSIAKNKFVIKEGAEDKISIVVHSWIVKAFYKFVFDNENGRNGIKKILTDHKLPSYKVFEEEKEITFKGGIFPHLILGIEKVNQIGKNDFYVNPALFDEINGEINSTIRKGFYIDQSNFKESLLKSPFESYFTFEGSDIAFQ